MKIFSISKIPLGKMDLRKKLGNPAAGALATFEGWVRSRNEGKRVLSLEYECFERLAIKEGAKIMKEAQKKFDLLGARCVHRVGRLKIGEMAVWVGVTAAHRGEAFAACQYIIDQVKIRIPIWKKEYHSKGESEWIEPQRSQRITEKTE